MQVLSREEYDEILQLVHPYDRMVKVAFTPSCVGLPSFSEEEKDPQHLSLCIEEPALPSGPYLPPAPPVLERQEGLYISQSETNDEEC